MSGPVALGPMVSMFRDEGRAPKLSAPLLPSEAEVMGRCLGVAGVLGGYLRAPWEGFRVGTAVGLGQVGGVRWWAVLLEDGTAADGGIAAAQQDPAASPRPNCANVQVIAGNSASCRASAQDQAGLLIGGFTPGGAP